MAYIDLEFDLVLDECVKNPLLTSDQKGILVDMLLVGCERGISDTSTFKDVSRRILNNTFTDGQVAVLVRALSKQHGFVELYEKQQRCAEGIQCIVKSQRDAARVEYDRVANDMRTILSEIDDMKTQTEGLRSDLSRLRKDYEATRHSCGNVAKSVMCQKAKLHASEKRNLAIEGLIQNNIDKRANLCERLFETITDLRDSKSKSERFHLGVVAHLQRGLLSQCD